MSLSILGIDIAKATYQVTLLHDGKSYRGEFANRAKEFGRLANWLKKHGASQVHACMEATGRYGDELAHYLHDAGQVVSVVNPLRIKSYARSRLIRNKTDPLDADVIADFCQTCQPPAWLPTPPEMRELQEFFCQYDALQDAITQTKNRLQSGFQSPLVLEQLQAQLDLLTQQLARLKQLIRDHIDRSPGLKQQRELLESIPAIGEITAARLISYDLLRFKDARAVSAFAGLTPMQGLSGTSVHRKTKLSKIGDPDLRRALYLPAVAALRWNPVIQNLAERLAARGKCKMSIIGAGMHKLLRLAYGVLKSGVPFDPTYSLTAQVAA
jgi:transposase